MLPLALAAAALTAAAIGIWLSALAIRYRDVRFAVPFFVQLGLFLTPVLVPFSVMSDFLGRRGLPPCTAGLNPMTAVVESFRWSLAGDTTASWGVFLTSAVAVVVVLLSGLAYFRRTERVLADLV